MLDLRDHVHQQWLTAGTQMTQSTAVFIHGFGCITPQLRGRPCDQHRVLLVGLVHGGIFGAARPGGHHRLHARTTFRGRRILNPRKSKPPSSSTYTMRSMSTGLPSGRRYRWPSGYTPAGPAPVATTTVNDARAPPRPRGLRRKVRFLRRFRPSGALHRAGSPAGHTAVCSTRSPASVSAKAGPSPSHCSASPERSCAATSLRSTHGHANRWRPAPARPRVRSP